MCLTIANQPVLKLPKWVGIGGRWVLLHLFLSVFSEYTAKKKSYASVYGPTVSAGVIGKGLHRSP